MSNSLVNNQRIEVLPINDWQAPVLDTIASKATAALEHGKVLYFPELAFDLKQSEQALLNPELVNPKTKNISFDLNRHGLRGALGNAHEQAALKAFMQRYAEYSLALVKQLFPEYSAHLEIGRTSLRVVEVAGRIAPSYRKDDTRLHVDAFPATPNQGRRLLRVFCNINPDNKPRVWRLGEPFVNVATRFMPSIKAPWRGSAWLLKKLKITKGLRTPYDHYMLQIHNRMKADMAYQKRVDSEEIHFPNRTWIVFTDQASHAALAGQHMLEQTFYLPVTGMVNPALSPLKTLEKIAGRHLL